ncbi:MAG: hypothetical protein RIR68_1024 [Pseudomonadota bacterium]
MLAVLSSSLGVYASEVFNGIPLEIAPPFLHEKLALQHTQIIAQAMARIAATVNEAHSASLQERPAWRQNTPAQNVPLRNALFASGADHHAGIAVKQIHHWKISPHHIQFDVDYYLPSRVGHAPEIYRDRYALTLTESNLGDGTGTGTSSGSGSVSGWHFSGHPHDTPIGKVTCQFVNALWVCPITP